MRKAIALGISAVLVFGLLDRLVHRELLIKREEPLAPTAPIRSSGTITQTTAPLPNPSAESNEQLKEQAMGSVLDADLAARLDAMISDDDARAGGFWQILLRRWTEADPTAAGEWAIKLPPGPVYREALQQVVTAWAGVDISAAMLWVTSLPEGDAKHEATISLAYESARVEPGMALQVAETLPASTERDNLLVYATSQWASTDAQSAMAWAREVPDPGLRQRLISAIATASAKLDGAAAAMMVSSLLQPGDEQDRAAITVVQRWAQSSPQAASDWVALYPEGPVRFAALQILNDLKAARESAITAGGVGKK